MRKFINTLLGKFLTEREECIIIPARMFPSAFSTDPDWIEEHRDGRCNDSSCWCQTTFCLTDAGKTSKDLFPSAFNRLELQQEMQQEIDDFQQDHRDLQLFRRVVM